MEAENKQKILISLMMQAKQTLRHIQMHTNDLSSYFLSERDINEMQIALNELDAQTRGLVQNIEQDLKRYENEALKQFGNQVGKEMDSDEAE